MSNGIIQNLIGALALIRPLVSKVSIVPGAVAPGFVTVVVIAVPVAPGLKTSQRLSVNWKTGVSSLSSISTHSGTPPGPVAPPDLT